MPFAELSQVFLTLDVFLQQAVCALQLAFLIVMPGFEPGEG